MPQTDLLNELLSFDKVVHFFIFGVLVFLMIIGLNKQYRYLLLRQNAIQISIGVGILYGLLIEFIQYLIPGRSFEFTDILANTFGCFIGLGMFYMVYKF